MFRNRPAMLWNLHHLASSPGSDLSGILRQSYMMFATMLWTIHNLKRKLKKDSIDNVDSCDQDIVDGTCWYWFKLTIGENGVLR